MIDKELVSGRFGKMADSYEAVTPVQNYMADELIGLVNQKIEKQPKRILEIGCGTGRITRVLKSKFPEAEITAIDISKKMVEKARKNTSGINFLISDAEYLADQMDGMYDLIISNATIQWFQKPARAVKSYKSKLNNEGVLIISTFGNKTFTELKQSFKNAYQHSDKHEREHSTTLYDLNYWKDQLPEADFEEIIFKPEFQSVREFLRSVQQAGATYSVRDVKPIPKEVYKKMTDFYKDNFVSNGSGKIVATYHSVFISIKI